MRLITKIAVGVGVATVAMGGLAYQKSQREIKYSKWFQEALKSVANHRGVNLLIGSPPFTIGNVTQHVVEISEIKPLETIDPDPLYVLEVPLHGDKGKGTIYMWLNLLCPKQEAVDNIEAWNVGLIEVQVGKNASNKFVVD